MPPYENTPEETLEALGTMGMEVAPDFIDNECLTRFTNKAIEWMQGKVESAKSGKPFFLYLPFTSPHYPVCPREEFWDQGDCGGYGEFMVETDYHVGRVLDYLEQSGLDENTIVIYASDNGPENSWRERVEEFGHHSNGIYRGGKRDIYEGGHRVPFFMRWPAGIKESGRSCDDLVGLVDLLATFADIVGAELPADAGEDSQSFAQILNEPDTKRERLPLINHGAAGRFAITEGHWKLVMAHKDETLEFYNLADDPGEMKNVVDDHPELVAELAKKITDIVCNGRTTAGDVQANDTGYWDDLTWVSPDDYQERQNTTS